MKKDKKEAGPKWPVTWGFKRNAAGRMYRQGKIGGLPLAIQHELNRRLQMGERRRGLVDWLNKLPETQTALARSLGGPKITLRNLAEWEKGGFRVWQARKATEKEIARQCQAWVLQPQTREKLFGRPLSYFERVNKMQQIMGLPPLTREDIPPGEDWDTIPTTRLTPAQREEAFRQILSIDDDDEESLDNNAEPKPI